MTYTYTDRFRVRYHECDLYEHVNNAIYLRYIENAACKLLSEAGLQHETTTRYANVEYIRPLVYGDRVEITVQPVCMAGASLELSFELKTARNGELSARAGSQVHLRRADDPAQELEWPPAVLERLFSETPLQGETRADLPQPPPPRGAFHMHREVRPQDVDPSGKVDLAGLLVYLEECGMQVIAAHHWPVERMLAEGFAILLRRNEIVCSEVAHPGDRLEISTWVSQLKRVTALRHYRIRRESDGAEIARVNALGVWVNLSTMQPMRIPPALLADFAPNIAEE